MVNQEHSSTNLEASAKRCDEPKGATQMVAEQYEKWVYPEPIEDLQAYHDTGRIDASAPKAVHWLYWPDGLFQRESANFKILVAGCGANAAARYAFEHPECQVVGIDLSAASLAHEEKLKEKHELDNLTLHQMPLEDVGNLGQEFDYIECSGVLHHLAEPVKGLLALKSVLKKPHGVISLMLYALYGRTGVYMLQDLFNRLGIKQNEKDLKTVKEMLKIVGRGHPLELFARTTIDFEFDAGVVDLFLHGVDHPYTVEQCLELSAASGMAFQGWLDNFYYYPDGQIPVTTEIFKHMAALPDVERWQAMELYHGAITKHAFFLTHMERDEKSYALDFEGADFMKMRPHHRINQFQDPRLEEGLPAMIQRLPFPALPLNDAQLALFAQCDGKRTMTEVIKAAKIRGQRDDVERLARNFFLSLWRVGYIMMEIPEYKK